MEIVCGCRVVDCFDRDRATKIRIFDINSDRLLLGTSERFSVDFEDNDLDSSHRHVWNKLNVLKTGQVRGSDIGKCLRP